MDSTRAEIVDMTAEIVSAYVGNNVVGSSDLPDLIHQVYIALREVTHVVPEEPAEPLKPAVNPKKSVFRDYIVCLEDGKKFKSLKRHLRTHYNLTPEEYRERWSLPKDYPMVAPDYAEERSRLAKEMGLGQKGRNGKKES